MNTDIFRLINDFAGQSLWLNGVGVFFTDYASRFIEAGALALGIWFFIKGRKMYSLKFLATVAVSVGGALVASYLLKAFIAELRPSDVLQNVHLLVPAETTFSFPSMHATETFALAVAVLLFSRIWGIVGIILASLVALSRIYVGVHWPLDIVGGALLGSLAAIAAFYCVKIIFKKLNWATDATTFSGRSRQ